MSKTKELIRKHIEKLCFKEGYNKGRLETLKEVLAFLTPVYTTDSIQPKYFETCKWLKAKIKEVQ
jgi:hypothetical protein